MDTTERLHFHFSLSCIGEGNGNPLQCSCLENPRDGGAWWAAIDGVAQSRTRLKRLSSSSSTRFWRRQWHPLQYSCLENPMGGGAWWAAVYGVTQSRTRLKQLSGSSSRRWQGGWLEHRLGEGLASHILSASIPLKPPGFHSCTWARNKVPPHSHFLSASRTDQAHNGPCQVQLQNQHT